MMTGLAHATGERVFLIDCDLRSRRNCSSRLPPRMDAAGRRYLRRAGSAAVIAGSTASWPGAYYLVHNWLLRRAASPRT